MGLVDVRVSEERNNLLNSEFPIDRNDAILARHPFSSCLLSEWNNRIVKLVL